MGGAPIFYRGDVAALSFFSNIFAIHQSRLIEANLTRQHVQLRCSSAMESQRDCGHVLGDGSRLHDGFDKRQRPTARSHGV